MRSGPSQSIHASDEQGHDVPRGTAGEIFLRRAPGTPPTYRYVGAEAKAIGDWESLGDMGWLDAEGYLYLTDRRTDMILVGGANVYPAEVEGVLDAHPHVRSSAVIGLLAVGQVAPWAPWEIPRADLEAEPIRGILERLRRTGELVLPGMESAAQPSLFQ